MKLEDEIKYRAAIAVDFLASMLNDDGEFVAEYQDGKKTNLKCTFVHHLHSVSLLYSAAEYFDKPSWCKTADRAFGLLGFSTFLGPQDPINQHVVRDDISLTAWNCMASIIHRKRGEFETSREFARSVLTCVDEEHTYAKYPATRPSNAITGYVILCLLETGKEEFLEKARQAAQIELRSPVSIDHYAIIALHQLDSKNDQYNERVKRAIYSFDRFEVKAMTSLFAAMAQQLYIPVRHDRERIEAVLEIQRELQVDKDHPYGLSSGFHGAFVKSKIDPEIRIDYVIHNAIALMQLLAYLKEEPLPLIL